MTKTYTAEQVVEDLLLLEADNQKSALTLGQEGLRGQCITTAKRLREIRNAYAATLRQAGAVDDREAFEQWAKGLPLDLRRTSVAYVVLTTQSAWLAWQAALARPASSEPASGEAVNGLIADHLISGLGKLANTVSKRMANDIRVVLGAMKPLYTHPAEPVNVPEGMVLVRSEDVRFIAAMQDADWPPQGAGSGELSAHWFASFKRKTERAEAMLAAAPGADGEAG